MMDRLGSLCKVGLEALHLINDDDDPCTLALLLSRHRPRLATAGSFSRVRWALKSQKWQFPAQAEVSIVLVYFSSDSL